MPSGIFTPFKTSIIFTSALILGLASAISGKAYAQEAIQIGKGSIASAPPPQVAKQSHDILTRPLYLVNQNPTEPIPTNKWWSDLLFSKFGRSIWPFPFKLDTSERGLEIFLPTRWQPSGNDPVSELPLTISGRDFTPVDSRVKSWSDWLVSFRLQQSDDAYIDITTGEGMPCVWAEYHGVDAIVKIPAGQTAVMTDLKNQAITLPFTGDAMAFTYADRSYGVFAPDGTQFVADGQSISAKFTGKQQYLVIAPLPKPSDLAAIHQYAFAIPRDTIYSYTYDPAKGTVDTIWTIKTDALKGDNRRIVQGWLPHHWRKTVNDLKLDENGAQGLDYISPRGPMRCSIGDTFHITWNFPGIVPNLPAPKVLDVPNPYSPARMHDYLTMLAAKPDYGGDTYWGGKDILRMGQGAIMAQQTDDSTRQTLVNNLHKAMADWFTYTPGETAHFFARYPKFRALVGFNTSYGSEAFNDHHFHYGYFTAATALLIQQDANFAENYGGIATQVAREYANWDRNSKDYPFLRTFDIWQGHSWASGSSSPGGQNQESSSEAVQSWAGLVYLGQALGDKDMLATGAMGYSIETQGVLEYWFNEYGGNFPAEWKHPVVGMVWGGGKNFGTYFTGDPAWIYGIQWLPSSPALSYLVRDPAFAKQEYANMIRDRAATGQPTTIKSFGAALGNVMLGYVLMYDPAWICQQLDELWNEPNDQIAHNASEMAIQYYMAHSTRNLGHVDWNCRTDLPTSMVYMNDQTHIRTAVLWNPGEKPVKVTVYENGKKIEELTAPAMALSGQKVTGE